MTYSQFVGVKRLSQKNHISVAAKHNLRELQSERGSESHIDHNRTYKNIILCGMNTAKGVSDYAKNLMEEAGVFRPRKNAMRAFEIVISLPVKSEVNQHQYFNQSLQWVRDFFQVPVISAVIHLDENVPHIHILLLPLSNGKMQGDKVVGDRMRIRQMHESFYQIVGQRHGLNQARKASRLNLATREKSASLFYNAIIDNPELLLKPKVETAIMNAFIKNSEPLLASIGKSIPNASKKSFVEIMCKPCKPENRKLTPIVGSGEDELTKPYVSVGISPPNSNQSISIPPHTAHEGFE